MTYNWQPPQGLPMMPNMNPVPQMSMSGYGPLPPAMPMMTMPMSYGRQQVPNGMQSVMSQPLMSQPLLSQPLMSQPAMSQPAMMHTVQTTIKRSPSNSPVSANDYSQPGPEKRKRKESMYVDLTEDDDTTATSQSLTETPMTSCRFDSSSSPTTSVPVYSENGQTNQLSGIHSAGQLPPNKNFQNSSAAQQVNTSDIITMKLISIPGTSPYFAFAHRMSSSTHRIYLGVCLIQETSESRKISVVGDALGARMRDWNQLPLIQWMSVCRAQKPWIFNAMSDIISPEEKGISKHFTFLASDDPDQNRLHKLGPSVYLEKQHFRLQYGSQTLVLVVKLTEEKPAGYYWSKLVNAIKIAKLKEQVNQSDAILKATQNTGPNFQQQTNGNNFVNPIQNGLPTVGQGRVPSEAPYILQNQTMTNGATMNTVPTQRRSPMGQAPLLGQNRPMENHPAVHQAMRHGMNGPDQPQAGRNVVNVGGHYVQMPTVSPPVSHSGVTHRANHTQATLPPPPPLLKSPQVRLPPIQTNYNLPQPERTESVHIPKMQNGVIVIEPETPSPTFPSNPPPLQQQGMHRNIPTSAANLPRMTQHMPTRPALHQQVQPQRSPPAPIDNSANILKTLERMGMESALRNLSEIGRNGMVSNTIQQETSAPTTIVPSVSSMFAPRTSPIIAPMASTTIAQTVSQTIPPTVSSAIAQTVSPPTDITPESSVSTPIVTEKENLPTSIVTTPSCDAGMRETTPLSSVSLTPALTQKAPIGLVNDTISSSTAIITSTSSITDVNKSVEPNSTKETESTTTCKSTSENVPTASTTVAGQRTASPPANPPKITAPPALIKSEVDRKLIVIEIQDVKTTLKQPRIAGCVAKMKTIMHTSPEDSANWNLYKGVGIVIYSQEEEDLVGKIFQKNFPTQGKFDHYCELTVNKFLRVMSPEKEDGVVIDQGKRYRLVAKVLNEEKKEMNCVEIIPLYTHATPGVDTQVEDKESDRCEKEQAASPPATPVSNAINNSNVISEKSETEAVTQPSTINDKDLAAVTSPEPVSEKTQLKNPEVSAQTSPVQSVPSTIDNQELASVTSIQPDNNKAHIEEPDAMVHRNHDSSPRAILPPGGSDIDEQHQTLQQIPKQPEYISMDELFGMNNMMNNEAASKKKSDKTLSSTQLKYKRIKQNCTRYGSRILLKDICKQAEKCYCLTNTRKGVYQINDPLCSCVAYKKRLTMHTQIKRSRKKAKGKWNDYERVNLNQLTPERLSELDPELVAALLQDENMSPIKNKRHHRDDDEKEWRPKSNVYENNRKKTFIASSSESESLEETETSSEDSLSDNLSISDSYKSDSRSERGRRNAIRAKKLKKCKGQLRRVIRPAISSDSEDDLIGGSSTDVKKKESEAMNVKIVVTRSLEKCEEPVIGMKKLSMAEVEAIQGRIKGAHCGLKKPRRKSKDDLETDKTSVKEERTEQPSGESCLDDFNSDALWDRLKDQEGIFPCVCGISFKTRPYYYVHKSVHGVDNPMSCGLCHATSQSWPEFHTHLMHAHIQSELSLEEFEKLQQNTVQQNGNEDCDKTQETKKRKLVEGVDSSMPQKRKKELRGKSENVANLKAFQNLRRRFSPKKKTSSRRKLKELKDDNKIVQQKPIPCKLGEIGDKPLQISFGKVLSSIPSKLGEIGDKLSCGEILSSLDLKKRKEVHCNGEGDVTMEGDSQETREGEKKNTDTSENSEEVVRNYPPECEICGIGYENAELWKCHKDVHSTDDTTVCRLCKYSSKNWNDFREHFEEVHYLVKVDDEEEETTQVEEESGEKNFDPVEKVNIVKKKKKKRGKRITRKKLSKTNKFVASKTSNTTSPTTKIKRASHKKYDMTMNIAKKGLGQFKTEDLWENLNDRGAIYPCVCELSFKKKALYDAHKEMHSDTNPKQCKSCLHESTTWADYHNHANVEHVLKK